MDNKTPKSKKKKILNVFDVIIIVIVIIAAAGFLLWRSGRIGGDNGAGEVQTTTVRYVMELAYMTDAAAEEISVGDDLLDNVKKYQLGEIVSFEIVPAVKSSPDLTTGEIRDQEYVGYSTAIITVEAECVETEKSITVGGGFEIRGGTAVSVTGPGYYGSGYILYVEREG